MLTLEDKIVNGGVLLFTQIENKITSIIIFVAIYSFKET